MIPYIKRLFTSEGAFVGFVRSVLMIFGLAVLSDKVALPAVLGGYGELLGFLGVGASMMMRSNASEKK